MHVQEGYSSSLCVCGGGGGGRWVGGCVCLLSHISLLEHLFVLKILSHTQWATEVKEFVGFSLKPLQCRDLAFPPFKAIRTVSHFPAESVHVHHSIYHVVVDFFPVWWCREDNWSWVQFRELPLVMLSSKVCPQWHELMVLRVCTLVHSCIM